MNRDKLAVKEEWKPTSYTPTLREYEVLQDIRVRSGIVGTLPLGVTSRYVASNSKAPALQKAK